MKTSAGKLFLAFLFIALADTCSAQRPVTLQCEYLENPIGIDAIAPRLTWRLDDDAAASMQQAYQVVVGTDSVSVAAGRGDAWQTAKTDGNRQLINYQGRPLKPYTIYYWMVRAWNGPGDDYASAVTSFETGKMNQANWLGSWISDFRSMNEKAAPYFRKSFNISRKVRSARAYVSAGGLFELSVNGQRPGEHRLDPMYTRFDRRLLYVTLDVTKELQSGENVIGVILGNGWYNHQSTAVWDFDRAPWRNRPAFCMDLRIVYEDGSVETVSTGTDWKTSTGDVVFNSIYTAEHHNANRGQQGWNLRGFADTAWKNAMPRSAPAPVIVSQSMRPIRFVDTIAVASLKKFSDTCYVFNLGRNIAGVSRLTVKGKAGTVIRLRHAERLYPNGHTDLSNIDVHYRPKDNTDPFQTDIFILKGTGEEEVFMPLFNYKGFQYVEVTSTEPLTLTDKSLTAYFMHSDVPAVGQVTSSNPVLNRIWAATNNSYLSNLMGYPTDCPQREKNGWTGDAHIASETGLYNFDGITVYEKWLADHRDEQQPNGVLPSIIPTDGWGYEWGNGPDWTSTIAIIPWNIYLFYGDTTLLSASYTHIKRYVDHITTISPTNLTTWGLGDWVPVKSQTPVELTSSAYYYTDVRILANAAKLLGKTHDLEFYDSLAMEIRTAFNKKYYHDGLYGMGVQTELSVPLQWGLVPDSLVQRVADNLALRVKADSNHIDVGLLGTKAILNALSEHGHADLAYKLASQETFPSWGWWIKNGATTLYENWPINAASDISMNHIMFGEIGAWMYKGLGGIRPDPSSPGFKNVLLEPHMVEGLDEFSCSHTGPYGKIRSAWKKTKKGGWKYEVSVPPNSTGTLRLVIAGKHKLYRNGKKVVVDGHTYLEQLNAGVQVYEMK